MSDLEKLKLILRESDSPFFTDEQLNFYLESNGNDIEKTAYQCFLLKAEDDSIALPGGLSLPNNKDYWLRLAKKYKPNGSRIL